VIFDKYVKYTDYDIKEKTRLLRTFNLLKMDPRKLEDIANKWTDFHVLIVVKQAGKTEIFQFL
jgi:hypothetical protein